MLNRQTQPIIITPAICTFPFFTEADGKTSREMDVTDDSGPDIKKWGWCRAEDVRVACEQMIASIRAAHIERLVSEWYTEDPSRGATLSSGPETPPDFEKQLPPWIFDFSNYIPLNSNRAPAPLNEEELTWFIAHEQGQFTRQRPARFCPFADSLLYIPAKFSKRILAAVGRGIKKVSRNPRSGNSILDASFFHHEMIEEMSYQKFD